MSEDRKQPGVAFWASVVVVVLLVLYTLSVGPFEWTRRHGMYSEGPTEEILCAFYHPLTLLCNIFPNSIGPALVWYVGLWIN